MTKKKVEGGLTPDQLDSIKSIAKETKFAAESFLSNIPIASSPYVPKDQIYFVDGKIIGNLPDRYRGRDTLSIICLEIEKRIGGKCSVEEKYDTRSYDFKWQPRNSDKIYQMRVTIDEFINYSQPNSDVVGWICDRLMDGVRMNVASDRGTRVTSLVGLNPKRSIAFGVGAYIRNSLRQVIGQVQESDMISVGPIGPGGPEYVELNLRLRCKTSDIVQIMLDEGKSMEASSQPIYIASADGDLEIKPQRGRFNMGGDFSNIAPSFTELSPEAQEIAAQITKDTKAALENFVDPVVLGKQLTKERSFFMSEEEIAAQEEETKRKREIEKAKKEEKFLLDRFKEATSQPLNGVVDTVVAGTAELKSSDGAVLGELKNVKISFGVTPGVDEEPYTIAEFIEELD